MSHHFHNQQLNVPGLSITMGQIRRWGYHSRSQFDQFYGTHTCLGKIQKVYLTCHIGNEFNSCHCQISTDVANEGFWKEMQILGTIVTFAKQ